MDILLVLALVSGLGLTHPHPHSEPHIYLPRSDGNATNAVALELASDNTGREFLESKVHATLGKRSLKTQIHAPWGLRDISHREPGDAYMIYPPEESKYHYDDDAGKGTWAYIIDGPIRLTHHELEDRAMAPPAQFPNGQDAGYGHGTAVAGIVAGRTYGVAKKARLQSVPLMMSGETFRVSDAIARIHWAVQDMEKNSRLDSSVINLSWATTTATGKSNALNKVIERIISQHDLPVVACAGNENEDAGKFSPASAKGVITVGSINRKWEVSSESNWGPAVTLLAPGVQVETSGGREDSHVVLETGSSFAAPYVTGLVLNAMSVHNIRGAKKIKQFILASATRHRGCLLIANNNNPDPDNDRTKTQAPPGNKPTPASFASWCCDGLNRAFCFQKDTEGTPV